MTRFNKTGNIIHYIPRKSRKWIIRNYWFHSTCIWQCPILREFTYSISVHLLFTPF